MGLSRAITVSGTHSARAGHGALGVNPTLKTPLDRATSTSRHYYANSGVGRHERELLIPPSVQAGAGGGGHTKGFSLPLTLALPAVDVRHPSRTRWKCGQEQLGTVGEQSPVPPRASTSGSGGHERRRGERRRGAGR